MPIVHCPNPSILSATLFGFLGSVLVIQTVSAEPLADLEMPLSSAGGQSVELESDVDQDEFVTAGRLTRLTRGSSGTQRFAVVNEDGEVLAFIAPTARVNLRRHLDQFVRLQARTLTWEEGRAPYVMVQRVLPLRETEDRRTSIKTASFNRVRKRPRRDDIFEARTVQHEAGSGEGWEVLPPGTEMGAGEIVDGEIVDGGIMGGEIIHGGGCDCGMDHGAACDYGIPCDCGTPCRGSCKTCRNEYCGPPGWLWLRGEYLSWWTDGMYLPPLVTTGTTASRGILNQTGTEILLGNNDVLDEVRSGYRIKFGGYWPLCRRLAWEGEYFQLSEDSFIFSATGDPNGNPVISRPFFNINPTDINGQPAPPAREDAELVSVPGIITGTVEVNARSKLQSAGGRLRWNLCCSSCGGCGGNCCGVQLNPRGHRKYSRIDLLFGYRYLNLEDNLTITEDLLSIDPSVPAAFDIRDSFTTTNEFHGGDIGLMWLGGCNRLSFEGLLKLGIGNVKQEALISGNTRVTTLGTPPQLFDIGILTLNSNIGTYSRNQLAVIPELGANLGYYMTPRLRATVGYTFLYLSRVLRPGEIVDLDVDPNGFAGEPQAVQVNRPSFRFIDTDYWAHGINAGLDLSW